MPVLTRWFIKSALLYLILALVVPLLLALNPLLDLPAFVGFLTPVYFHIFMVGWVTQMIFGVIYWMFPIISRERPRGSAELGWASFVLLNVGLWFRIVGEPMTGLNPGSAWGWVLLGSALLQWLAGVAFVITAWPRVRDRYRGE